MNTLRYTGILFCFASVACARMAPAIESKVNGAPIHVCKSNLSYRIVDNKLSNKRLKVIRKSIEYWNLLVDKPLFVEVDYDSERKPDILVDTYNLNKDNNSQKVTGGRTSIFYSDTSETCVVAAVVLLNKSDVYDQSFDNDFFQTIVRHEFGHILGLDDIDDNHNSRCNFPDLMCHKANHSYAVHPMDVNEEHVARLRSLYPNRTWKERANQWMLDE